MAITNSEMPNNEVCYETGYVAGFKQKLYKANYNNGCITIFKIIKFTEIFTGWIWAMLFIPLSPNASKISWRMKVTISTSFSTTYKKYIKLKEVDCQHQGRKHTLNPLCPEKHPITESNIFTLTAIHIKKRQQNISSRYERRLNELFTEWNLGFDQPRVYYRNKLSNPVVLEGHQYLDIFQKLISRTTIMYTSSKLLAQRDFFFKLLTSFLWCFSSLCNIMRLSPTIKKCMLTKRIYLTILNIRKLKLTINIKICKYPLKMVIDK